MRAQTLAQLSCLSPNSHHNFIVNYYLFLLIVIMPNPCAGLKDFCESLSGICRRIENIQPQSISISSMNEQFTNTPHIKYSYLGLSAHKYPDIENNNLPWPGVMFCQRRNVIGKCVSCHNGRNVPAAYWPRLPSDQSELMPGPKHSLRHTFTDNFRGIYDCIVSAACVRWQKNTKHSWCHLLRVTSGQQHIMGPGPAVIRLSALRTLSRSIVAKYRSDEMLLITQSWFCVVNEWDYNSRLRYVGEL